MTAPERDAQFVKWSCGCKGLIIGEHCWVIKSCDGEDSSLSLYERSMLEKRRIALRRQEVEEEAATGTAIDLLSSYVEEELDELVMKDFEPLPYLEVVQLLHDLSRLLADGHGLRQLQNIISRKWEPHEVEGTDLTRDEDLQKSSQEHE